MTAISVSPNIRTLTQAARYTRNGRVPDAAFHTEMIGLMNSAAAFRGKEVFRSVGSIADIPAQAAGTRHRHRFAFHTGPFAEKITAVFVISSLTDGLTDNAYARLALTDSAGTVTTSANWYAGASPNVGGIASTDYPDNFSIGFATLAVTADTDCYGLISDVDHARIVSVVVFEEALAPDTANGYVNSSVAANGPIFYQQREDLITAANLMWKRGGSQLANWCSEIDSAARVAVAVKADTNIVDNSSTTVSAATPGFTLDLTGKSTLTGGGVECKMAAYGIRTGTAGNSGVKLKDSSGTTLLNLNGVGASLGWFVSTVTLPASKAKYDLQYFSSNGTTTIYAVSIWEYKS